MPVDVDTLRRLFKHLLDFRNLVEETGTDEITWEGEVWVYHDLVYLYEASQAGLPRRQAESIRFFLVGQMREEDVAVLMGLKPTNPIGMYATTGLARLVSWIDEGQLPRFRAEERHGTDALRRTQGSGGGGGRAA